MERFPLGRRKLQGSQHMQCPNEPRHHQLDRHRVAGSTDGWKVQTVLVSQNTTKLPENKCHCWSQGHRWLTSQSNLCQLYVPKSCMHCQCAIQRLLPVLLRDVTLSCSIQAVFHLLLHVGACQQSPLSQADSQSMCSIHTVLRALKVLCRLLCLTFFKASS
jgi:hypothetical protein